jgi:hypothetical protein
MGEECPSCVYCMKHEQNRYTVRPATSANLKRKGEINNKEYKVMLFLAPLNLSVHVTFE